MYKRGSGLSHSLTICSHFPEIPWRPPLLHKLESCGGFSILVKYQVFVVAYNVFGGAAIAISTEIEPDHFIRDNSVSRTTRVGVNVLQGFMYA